MGSQNSKFLPRPAPVSSQSSSPPTALGSTPASKSPQAKASFSDSFSPPGPARGQKPAPLEIRALPLTPALPTPPWSASHQVSQKKEFPGAEGREVIDLCSSDSELEAEISSKPLQPSNDCSGQKTAHSQHVSRHGQGSDPPTEISKPPVRAEGAVHRLMSRDFNEREDGDLADSESSVYSTDSSSADSEELLQPNSEPYASTHSAAITAHAYLTAQRQKSPEVIDLVESSSDSDLPPPPRAAIRKRRISPSPARRPLLDPTSNVICSSSEPKISAKGAAKDNRDPKSRISEDDKADSVRDRIVDVPRIKRRRRGPFFDSDEEGSGESNFISLWPESAVINRCSDKHPESLAKILCFPPTDIYYPAPDLSRAGDHGHLENLAKDEDVERSRQMRESAVARRENEFAPKSADLSSSLPKINEVPGANISAGKLLVGGAKSKEKRSGKNLSSAFSDRLAANSVENARAESPRTKGVKDKATNLSRKLRDAPNTITRPSSHQPSIVKLQKDASHPKTEYRSTFEQLLSSQESIAGSYGTLDGGKLFSVRGQGGKKTNVHVSTSISDGGSNQVLNKGSNESSYKKRHGLSNRFLDDWSNKVTNHQLEPRSKGQEAPSKPQKHPASDFSRATEANHSRSEARSLTKTTKPKDIKISPPVSVGDRLKKCSTKAVTKSSSIKAPDVAQDTISGLVKDELQKPSKVRPSGPFTTKRPRTPQRRDSKTRVRPVPEPARNPETHLECITSEADEPYKIDDGAHHQTEAGLIASKDRAARPPALSPIKSPTKQFNIPPTKAGGLPANPLNPVPDMPMTDLADLSILDYLAIYRPTSRAAELAAKTKPAPPPASFSFETIPSLSPQRSPERGSLANLRQRHGEALTGPGQLGSDPYWSQRMLEEERARLEEDDRVETARLRKNAMAAERRRVKNAELARKEAAQILTLQEQISLFDKAIGDRKGIKRDWEVEGSKVGGLGGGNWCGCKSAEKGAELGQGEDRRRTENGAGSECQGELVEAEVDSDRESQWSEEE